MGNYRGPVAFGFEPADAFWTNKNTFEKFVIATFKGTDAYDEDYSVYEGSGFDLADHRDTAGCYGKADSVEDFVVENLDLSTCPETTILDAYINEDEARLVVKVLSTEEDIAEIKHWELTPYGTMDFERVDSVGDDTYEIIFKIDRLNPSYTEFYDESKDLLFDKVLNEEGLNVKDLHKTMVNTYNAENVEFEAGKKARYNNKVVTLIKPMDIECSRWQIKYSDGHKESVSRDLIKPYKTELSARKELYGEDIETGGNLRESARARLSVELRQFVARFVQDMETARQGIKDYDKMMEAYAELAIKTAEWVGLPVEVLKHLNYILSDDCLNCDMWDLVNAIVGIENRKKMEN